MGTFAAMVKTRKKRPGFSDILLPGEQEARRVERKLRNGVPLVLEVLEDLLVLRKELEIETDIEILGPYQESYV
jgi:LDH2 family malate/lactate/ureidoglycolate dehydrogenase